LVLSIAVPDAILPSAIHASRQPSPAGEGV
jgi:hypothetical protein